MSRAVGALFAHLIIATTVFALNLFFVSVAGVLQLLPRLAPLVGRLVWGILLLSCRLYYLVLVRVSPYVQRRFRIRLLEGLWRLGTIILLSLGLGVGFYTVARISMTIWTITPLVLHGLFVDFVWEEIPDKGGLQMGVRM
jgi:hypothetical protein